MLFQMLIRHTSYTPYHVFLALALPRTVVWLCCSRARLLLPSPKLRLLLPSPKLLRHLCGGLDKERHFTHVCSFPYFLPPLSSVSPRGDDRESIDFSDVTATTTAGGVHVEHDHLAFEARFREAMESGLIEVRRR